MDGIYWNQSGALAVKELANSLAGGQDLPSLPIIPATKLLQLQKTRGAQQGRTGAGHRNEQGAGEHQEKGPQTVVSTTILLVLI